MGGGKVAVLILASTLPWTGPVPDHPLADLSPSHVHVISLSEYETGDGSALDESIVNLLESANEIVGHNVKSDLTRLRNDYNIEFSQDDVTDTMQLATAVYGPPEAWNPHSR